MRHIGNALAMASHSQHSNDSGSHFGDHDGYVVATPTSVGLVDQVVSDVGRASAALVHSQSPRQTTH
jgi:hypothetical protein